MGSSIRLGRVFGIPIGLHYTWFLVFFAVTWLLAENIYPNEYPQWSKAESWGSAVATSLLFFASVVAHELGHSLVAMAHGIKVKSITLFVFGGVAQISREASRPLVEFLIAIAGPLVSAALGGVFIGIHLLTEDASRLVSGVSLYLGQINLMLAVFNMIPGFPLDGGRVFRAVVWGLRGNHFTATRLAARAGQGVGAVFIAGGLAMGAVTRNVFDGIWLAFIGWFLAGMAGQQLRYAQLRETLKGVRVRDVMNGGATMIPAGIDLRSLVEHYIALTSRRSFLVGDGDRWAGLVSVTDIKAVPRNKWPQTTVEQIMVPVARVVTVEADEDALRAIELMDERNVSQAPVMERGVLVGLLRREQVLEFLKKPEQQPRGARA